MVLFLSLMLLLLLMSFLANLLLILGRLMLLFTLSRSLSSSEDPLTLFNVLPPWLMMGSFLVRRWFSLAFLRKLRLSSSSSRVFSAPYSL